jgi:hypothetical protein
VIPGYGQEANPKSRLERRGVSLPEPIERLQMKRIVICAAALVIGSMAFGGPARADSAGGHCPPPNSGFIVWDVNTEPYQADNRVDEQGNNNGIVCARPLKIIIDENGNPFQIYNFIDDRGALPHG